MFTAEDAKAAGWELVADAENGTAYKDGDEMFQVTSGIPMFSMLNEIAEREGQARIAPTSESVAAATRETYVEPPPVAIPAKVADRDALVAKLQAGKATPEEVQQALAQVLR